MWRMTGTLSASRGKTRQNFTSTVRSSAHLTEVCIRPSAPAFTVHAGHLSAFPAWAVITVLRHRYLAPADGRSAFPQRVFLDNGVGEQFRGELPDPRQGGRAAAVTHFYLETLA